MEQNRNIQSEEETEIIREHGPEAFGLKWTCFAQGRESEPETAAETQPRSKEESEQLGRLADNRLKHLVTVLHGGLEIDTSAQEETRLRAEVERCREIVKKNPASGEPELAMAYNNLAGMLQAAGRAAEAEALYCEALDIYRCLAERRPAAYEPYAAQICGSLAVLLSGTERVSAAEWFYRQALDTWRRLAERHPVSYAPEVADSCFHLAIFLFYVKEDRKGARIMLEHALALYEQYPHMAQQAADAKNMLDEYYS